MKTGDRSEIEDVLRGRKKPKTKVCCELSVSASEGGNPSGSHDRCRCPPIPVQPEYLFSSTYTSRSPLSPTPPPPPFTSKATVATQLSAILYNWSNIRLTTLFLRLPSELELACLWKTAEPSYATVTTATTHLISRGAPPSIIASYRIH